MKRSLVKHARNELLVLWTCALIVAGSTAGCQSQVVREVASPDGTWVASVRSHPAIDPPAQSLWLGPPGARGLQLARLAEDQEWCDEVVWSDDVAQVGFLVNGARLDLYAVPEGRFLGSTALLPPEADPGRREARQVAFSPGGRSIAFADCARGSSHCLGRREIRLTGDT